MSAASPDTEARIRRWLGSLAELTAPGSEPVSAERIATMAAMLAKDAAPAAAYGSGSLYQVAGLGKFFPSYVEVRDAVHLWWEANRPAHAPALEGPGLGDDATLMDRSWLAFWHKRRAEIWATDVYQRGSRDADMANLASLVQQQSPKAWAVIRGREPAQHVATEAEREAVLAKAQAFYDDVASRSGSIGTRLRDVTLSREQLQAKRQAVTA